MKLTLDEAVRSNDFMDCQKCLVNMSVFNYSTVYVHELFKLEYLFSNRSESLT